VFSARKDGGAAMVKSIFVTEAWVKIAGKESKSSEDGPHTTAKPQLLLPPSPDDVICMNIRAAPE